MSQVLIIYFHFLTLFSLSTVHIITERLSISWPWYVIRAAGFTAAGLLILLMLSGIGQVTGFTYKFIEPLKAWAIHKTLAYALIIAGIIHVGFLLIDQLIKFNLSQIFIPFLNQYNNKTTLLGIPLQWAAIGLGVLSMYGILIIVISSLGIIHTRKKAWKKIHLLSYLVFGAVFLHALYAGSDLRYGVFRAFWVLGGLFIVVAMIMRWRRAGSLKDIDDDHKN